MFRSTVITTKGKSKRGRKEGREEEVKRRKNTTENWRLWQKSFGVKFFVCGKESDDLQKKK